MTLAIMQQTQSTALGLVGRSSQDAVATDAQVDLHFARRGHGEEFAMEVRWILRSLPQNASRVLDVGCGIGALFPAIGSDRVVGIDYAFAGLRCTRSRHPDARLSCADGAKLPFADASFDAITAQHIIEHMVDPISTLAEWRRVLCPGGRVVLVTPNSGFCDTSIFDDPTHVRLFDRASLRQSLTQGGLEIEQICTLGLPQFRNYHAIAGGWRFRRAILKNAEILARIPLLQWSGQSLCCVARRSDG